MNTKILIFTGKLQASFEERGLPDPADGEFLVRNDFSLVSPGTELALYTGTHIGFDDPEITWAVYPLDIGYASAGTVLQSKNTAFPEGSRVVHYGAHASFSLLNESTVASVIPDGLDKKTACFGRFAQIAASSVEACVRKYGKVLVYGAGIVGNLSAQWFSLKGADTVCIRDLSEDRMLRASSCGITVDGGDSDDAPATVIEATGAPSVVNEALKEVAVGGQVVLIGSTRGPVEINVYKMIHRKVVALSGAHETILGERRKEVLTESLDRLADGGLKVASLMTHVITPDDLPGVYERILENPNDYLGVHVDWSTWHD